MSVPRDRFLTGKSRLAIVYTPSCPFFVQRVLQLNYWSLPRVALLNIPESCFHVVAEEIS